MPAIEGFKQLFVCEQVKEEEDSRPKKPLQRKTAKTTEEGNSIKRGASLLLLLPHPLPPAKKEV